MATARRRLATFLATLLVGAVLTVAPGGAGGAAAQPPPDPPPLFVVDSTLDVPDDQPGDGVCLATTAEGPVCTLRAAVAEANATSGAQIGLEAGTYALRRGGGDNRGDLDLKSSMSIVGVGAASVTIDGQSKVRVLDVRGSAEVTLEGVAVRNGRVHGSGGGALVRKNASLTVRDVEFEDNWAWFGGAIHANGAVTVEAATLVGNTATVHGGALSVGLGAAASAVNATMTGNDSPLGAAVGSAGATTVDFVTIAGNTTALSFGGSVLQTLGSTTITNSILFGTTTGGNPSRECAGLPTIAGVNVVADATNCDVVDAPIEADPLLGVLADNGGPTRTIELLDNSPAIDAVATCAVAVDQRGNTRPAGPGCDLGAFEAGEPLAFTLDGFTTSATEVGVGAQFVPSEAIPPAVLGLIEASGGTTAATPLTSIDVAWLPLTSIDTSVLPLTSIPLTSIAEAVVPLTSIPLTSIPLTSIPLTSILLSDIAPLDTTWDTLLAGTQYEGLPLQAVSLEDVIGLPQVGQLTLASFDVSNSPLTSIPLTSILLGSAPLTSIAPLETWCGPAFVGGEICTALGLDPAQPSSADDTSILTLALAGVPLTSIPLTSIPLTSIPLTSIDEQPLPLTSIPLTSIDWASTPLTSIPLTSIDPASPILAECPVGAETVGECAGQFQDSTLGDLLADTDAQQLGQYAYVDVLLGLLPAEDIPWAELDLDAVPLQNAASPLEPAFDYLVDFTTVGGPATVTAELTLPPGFVLAEPEGATLDDVAVTPTDVSLVPTVGTECETAALVDCSFVLTFELADVTAGAHQLAVASRASLQLGSAEAGLAISASDGTDTIVVDPVPTSVTVVEAFEGGTESRSLQDGFLSLSHISVNADVDLYEFTVTPAQAAAGFSASIALSNLAIDADIVLFGPPSVPLRQTPTQRLGLVEDRRVDLSPGDDREQPDTVQDIPLGTPADLGRNLVVTNIAATRGTVDERIDTGTLAAGDYLLQVSAYNGSFSDDAYTIRARTTASAGAPACPARTFPFPAGAPGAALDVASLPADLNTVFLVNTSRLVAAYGPTAAPSALAVLPQVAGADDLGVIGAVVDLSGDPAVTAAYAAWDLADNACDPDAANAVVAEVGAVLDTITAARPTVENIVIVGDDTQVPMARVVDGTTLSNERTFAQEIFTGQTSNALVGALRAGQILTDDAYGSDAGIAVNDHELFVPTRAVGRLVESPADIQTQLQHFLTFEGRLDPTTSALSTGYDFLTDGAQRVRDALGDNGLQVNDSLISDTWTSTDLATALGANPTVASVNAHFDNDELLPGLGNRDGSVAELFDVTDVPTDLERSVLFSMGCHGGLSTSDIELGVSTPDWAQTLAPDNLWLANTGYGYGDTDIVALSERLTTLFAERVTSTTVGRAMVLAKQRYLGETPILNPYDEKILQVFTFYGLPMYTVGTAPTPPAPPTPPDVVTDPVTGLDVAEVDFDFDIGTGTGDLNRVDGAGGSYFEVDGQTVQVQNRPVQPRADVDVTQQNLVAAGGLVTGLSSVGIQDFDPLEFRPTVDLTANEPRRVAADSTFPSKITEVTNFLAADGPRQLLNVIPGQFIAGDTPGRGTQRLLTDIDVLTYYAPSTATDLTPPEIQRTIGIVTDGVAQFGVEADVGVQRVLVLFRPVGSTTPEWTAVDLGESPPGNWFGFRSVGSTDVEEVEYFVQAVGANGAVGISRNKAVNFLANDPAPGLDAFELTIPPIPPSGFFGPNTMPVVVTPSPAGVAPFFWTVNGGEPNGPDLGLSLTQFEAVTGNNDFAAIDSSGQAASVNIPVDLTRPEVFGTLDPPVSMDFDPFIIGTQTTLTIEATDAQSGVESITYTVSGESGSGPPITVSGDMATVVIDEEGATEVVFTARDRAGNVSALSAVVAEIDLTPPVITCDPTPTGWSAVNVTIGCTADDLGIGLADVNQESFDLTTSVPPDTEDANAFTNSVVVCDLAGNCATAGPEGPIQVDRLGPTVTVTTPLDGATFTQGQVVNASYSCSDGGSGLAAVDPCVGSVPDGAPIDTSTVGPVVFTVSGTDAVGNVTVVTNTYNVT